MNDERRTLSIDWVQLSAGALTAVSSAVLLSTVGVAGTLVGAAVGSVLGTVGNAVYAHYLALSKERVAHAKVLAASRTGDAEAHAAAAGTRAALDDPRGELGHGRAGHERRRAREDLTRAEETAGVAWRDAVSGLPWRKLLPAAAAVFVVTLAAIVTFEVLAGQSVSTYTGGSDARTSVPGLGGDADEPDPTEKGPSETVPSEEDRQRKDEPEPGDVRSAEVSPAPSPPSATTSEPAEPTEPATGATRTPSPTGTPTPAQQTPSPSSPAVP